MKHYILFNIITIISLAEVLAQAKVPYLKEFERCQYCGEKKNFSFYLRENKNSEAYLCAELLLSRMTKVSYLYNVEDPANITSADISNPHEIPYQCGGSTSGDHNWKRVIENKTLNLTKDQIDSYRELEQKSNTVSNVTSAEKPMVEVEKKSELFTGVGSVTYSNGDKYQGPIVEGKPHGEGKLISSTWGGSVSCSMNHGEVSKWKYILEIDHKMCTTEQTYGTTTICKIDDKTILNSEYQNGQITSGTFYYPSGNKLFFKKTGSGYEYEATKILSNGNEIHGKQASMNFPFQRMIVPIIIPTFYSDYPKEILINGEGKLKLKDGTEVIGRFYDDIISNKECKIRFANGNYYSGEIQLHDDTVFMHGKGILWIKGNRKSKEGYWKYNEYVGRKNKD